MKGDNFRHNVLLFLIILWMSTLWWTQYSSWPATYIDKKCPFTGDVSIRGRIIAGTCHSAKMVRTIIVRRNYLHWVKKYQRYEAIQKSPVIVFSCTNIHLIRVGFWSIGTRKGIQISQLTYPPASVWKRVTMWSSVNAGQNWNRISFTNGTSWII